MPKKKKAKKSAGYFEALLWWEAINYGGDRQYFPLTSEYFNPHFLPGFSNNQLAVLETLTFVCWKKRSWRVRAAVCFLEARLDKRGIGSGAIKRALKKLAKQGLLQCWPNQKLGNEYLVACTLMQDTEREKLKHFAESFFLAAGKKDLFDPSTEVGAAQKDRFDPTDGSDRSNTEKLPKPKKDRNDPQILGFNSSLGDASRQRCPSGSITGEGNKGVLPDSIKLQVENLKKGLHPEGRPFESEVV
jgi:hypothetical protein